MTPKTATYLVTLTISFLFTTCEADFNIEKGKTAVNRLLTRFIGIALEHQSNNLDDLVRIGDELIKQKSFADYLGEAAIDENYAWGFLNKTDIYYQNFQKLLLEAKIYAADGTSVKQDFIPMWGTLLKYRTNLVEAALWLVDIVLLKGSWSGRFEPREDHSYFIRITRDELYEKDKYGFEPRKGIQEMIILLHELLKLELDKNCADLTSLKITAAKIMNVNTALYEYLMSATVRYADDIMEEIVEYKKGIRDASSNDLRNDDRYIPLNTILSKIQKECETKSGEGSSSKGQY